VITSESPLGLDDIFDTAGHVPEQAQQLATTEVPLASLVLEPDLPVATKTMELKKFILDK
jgi:hypothetical protein